MDNKNQKTIILVALILLIVWYFYNQNSSVPKVSNGNGNGNGGSNPLPDIMGCTNSLASNFNPSATSEDGSCIMGYQGCCDSQGTNYDAGCSGDPACQCTQSECNMLSGRTACCDSDTSEYDPTCLGDSNCSCDNSLCGQVISSGGRTSCCTLGANNYDSTCSNDPFCTCDNTGCQFPSSAHTCYTGCIGTGFQDIYTTEPCGTGYASNFPNVNPPYNCGGASA